MSENSERYSYNYLNDLIIATDETVRRSAKITSLETFNSTEAHNSDCEDSIVKEARRRHIEKLNHYDLQWWDKLPL